ncbi:hypothetical protein [Azospirillum thermophilum]|uniref:Uncharacterized protein n=1 Tax=Azospirillum thermophilum TaxID=2202148 RepID=A0A2S2CSD6_9PROT|nr:hypothetical protein [Azospirillum thermophilum]AWK87424.1 hypothetical protein DEW08_15410 [Azospirillum thermophilum]
MTSQHLLFDDLPETERPRKPARRSRASHAAAPVAVDVVREPVPAPPPASLVAAGAMSRAAAGAAGRSIAAGAAATLPLAPPRPPPPAPAFDPAALTNPELRALVQALPDQRLGHLLVEAARELKRRVAPDADADGMDADDPDSGPAEPNPLLIRAARQAVGELSGEDA